MTVDRFFEMLRLRKNVLVKPKLWDDPFENIVLNSYGKLPSGELVEFGMREHLFAQCWSLKRELDAMWRTFTPNKNGVKIESTIKLLFDSLNNAPEVDQEKKTVSCFIGEVEYFTKNAFHNKIKSIQLLDNRASTVAETLLIKRNPFRPEKEVRLIYFEPDEKKIVSDIFSYSFNPFKVINRMTFDPRMSDELYRIYKKEVISLGYKGNVIKSGLYRPPKGFVIPI